MDTDPIEQAEAGLLGRIIADEEARAAGTATGPRLLEQARSWGITSGGLFASGYHRMVWERIQQAAADGRPATRVEVDQRLRAAAEPAAQADAPAPVHPDAVHGAHLARVMVAGEGSGRADRSAAMVVDAAMHRSTHDLAAEVDRAARTGSGVGEALTAARTKLSRMRTAWGRLPEQARRDVAATRARPEPTPIQRAQQELAEARTMMQNLATDPGYAAQMVAEPAWGVLDKLAGALDGLANASVDAPRSPGTPAERSHLRPGEVIPEQPGAWARQRQDDAERQAEEDAADNRRRMVTRAEDALTFGEGKEPAPDPERAADEARLLGSLAAAPDQLAELDLDPADIADAGVRRAVEVALELHEQGSTPDAELLDWALLARGAPALAETATEPVTDRDATLGGLAARVTEAAANSRVASAVQRLRTLGTDPATAPEQLIDAAEQALQDVGTPPPERTLSERTEVETPEHEQEHEAPAAGNPEPEAPSAAAAAEPAERHTQEPHAAPAPAQRDRAAEQVEAPEQRRERLEQTHLDNRADRAADAAPPPPEPVAAAPEPPTPERAAAQIEH